MKIDISCNAKALTEAMKQKAGEVPIVMQKAVTDATTVVLAEARNQLASMVYNQPIPKRKNGKPAWKRTSNLIRQERAYYDKPFQGVIDNRAPYAYNRHQLNRPSPIDGKVRRAPWRQEAAKKAEPKAKSVMEQAIKALTSD